MLITSLSLTPTAWSYHPRLRTPIMRYKEWNRRPYVAPSYRPPQELVVRNTIAFEWDKAYLPQCPQRFDHPILVQSFSFHDDERYSTFFIIGVTGTASANGAMINLDGPNFILPTRELLCIEEEKTLISFLETLFGNRLHDIPPGSIWRSHDPKTNVVMPFPSGKTWADVWMPPNML